jgi:hypothetical protein
MRQAEEADDYAEADDATELAEDGGESAGDTDDD